MQPRKKTSKKWTAFPGDYTAQIREALAETFPEPSAKGTFEVEGRIYGGEVLLRIGYLPNGKLAQANFEISADVETGGKNTLEKISICIDAAASMMADYFEKDQVSEFPLLWASYPFQDETIYLQFSSLNSKLEAEADRLLGLSSDSLVRDADEDEEDMGPSDPMKKH